MLLALNCGKSGITMSVSFRQSDLKGYNITDASTLIISTSNISFDPRDVCGFSE